jgi:hypothetical protein
MTHRAAAAAVLVAAALLSACGGSAGDEFPRVVTLGEGNVFPAILNSSLTVGDNRLVLRLTDPEDTEVIGARVDLALYDLRGEDPAIVSETAARFISSELFFIDELGDRSRTVTGESGVYVAPVSFEGAGDWGLKLDIEGGGVSERDVPFRFTVVERSAEPMVGDAAPRSVQQTTATVTDIAEIDSSFPPRPHMHDVTIADAIAAGRASVVAFATPAFCRSRTCGPVLEDVMDPLYEEYGDRAEFIHVEPYVLRDLRAGFVQNPTPAAREWRLQSEPWIFVLDGQGMVRAKFEGIVAVDEVQAVLEQVLAPL